MRRPRGIVLVMLGVMAAVAVVMLCFVPSMFVVDLVTIRVTGRLVEADTRVPIPSAWVLVIPDPAWADDGARLERANAEGRYWFRELQRPGAVDVHGLTPARTPTAGAVTAADGSFTVVVTHLWGTKRTIIDLSPARVPPRYRTGAIWIETEGRAPVLLDAPTGTWTEHPDAPRLWADYGMGIGIPDSVRRRTFCLAAVRSIPISSRLRGGD